MGEVRFFPTRPSVEESKGHEAVSTILAQLETWVKERMNEVGCPNPHSLCSGQQSLQLTAPLHPQYNLFLPRIFLTVADPVG